MSVNSYWCEDCKQYHPKDSPHMWADPTDRIAELEELVTDAQFQLDAARAENERLEKKNENLRAEIERLKAKHRPDSYKWLVTGDNGMIEHN